MLTAELAGIKHTIESADAELIRFRHYQLELHHRATQLAADMQRLKNQRKEPQWA
jgi:hypothetical protein